MKNKQNNLKIKNKYTRNQIKEMILNDDESSTLDEIMKSNLNNEEMKMIDEVFREVRLDELFEHLNIDSEKLDKAKKQVVKLKPNSKKFKLVSSLFRNHNGNYHVEYLFNEYHDYILKEGEDVGCDYGKKFIIEDLQNKRFTKEDIINMSDKEVDDYCNENRGII